MTAQAAPIENWDDVTEEYEYDHCVDCDAVVARGDGVRTLLDSAICNGCAEGRYIHALETE